MKARIKKINDQDHNNITIDREFSRIDEQAIDGPKLMAMLGNEELIGVPLTTCLKDLIKQKLATRLLSASGSSTIRLNANSI